MRLLPLLLHSSGYYAQSLVLLVIVMLRCCCLAAATALLLPPPLLPLLILLMDRKGRCAETAGPHPASALAREGCQVCSRLRSHARCTHLRKHLWLIIASNGSMHSVPDAPRQTLHPLRHARGLQRTSGSVTSSLSLDEALVNGVRSLRSLQQMKEEARPPIMLTVQPPGPDTHVKTSAFGDINFPELSLYERTMLTVHTAFVCLLDFVLFAWSMRARSDTQESAATKIQARFRQRPCSKRSVVSDRNRTTHQTVSDCRTCIPHDSIAIAR